MPEWWPALLGWPAIGLGVALSAFGIASRRPLLLLAAALLVTPFGYYLSGAENWLAVVGLATPLSFLAAAGAVGRRRPWLAWAILGGFVGLIAWIHFLEPPR